ncbi:MAG TPA: ATP-binding protein [Bryobacteraceae bacterium]|jgi:signal transduction histidine kinase
METSTLLNVDDHEAARYARTRILSTAGFRVLDASTGKQTLDLAEKHRPDLILLDVHLPDLNGIEVCRRLKRTHQESPIIVIQISASALTPSHATAALDAGADAYLMEPVDPDVLVATVKAMLRLHEAEKSLGLAKRQLEIANNELRRSNEDLQQFAFAASHDLQEPLRAVTAFTEALAQDLNAVLTEAQRTYIGHIVNGTGRMRVLIRDLLAYSQVGREGRPEVAVDLRKAVDWAVANLREQIDEADAKVEIAKNLPSVWGDFAHVGLVCQNLLSNSLKYRKPDEPLVVRIEAESSSPGEWIIAVKDNGAGIEPKFHDQIFAPFKRLHGAEIPGTGIGLALCRRIMEAHGGRIWVQSERGKGATFRLAFSAI